MKKTSIEQDRLLINENDRGESGSAIIIALFILALISIFVALAMSRSSAEAAASGNETAQARALYAAQGSLEMMTRNFNKKFEVNINPTDTDFNDVRNAPVPGLSVGSGGQYTFGQEVLKIPPNPLDPPPVLAGGPFSGLYAKRDTWRLRTTATDAAGVQVQLTRNILNNLVPIFQFGIFYNDDLEFHPGPLFNFGGRVHSNGSLFMQAGTGLYFESKVTAANFIYTDVSKNGSVWTTWDDNVFVRNASGTFVQLQYNMGSVLSSPTNGAPVVSSPAPMTPLPTAYNSASWPSNKALFDGNLLSNVAPLQLPLKLNSDITGQGLDLIEVIKRGKNVGDVRNSGGTPTSPNITPVTSATKDDAITAAERYYNKTGFRVALADEKRKLPGCANSSGGAVTGACGVQLDGHPDGQSTYTSGPRGYIPRAMTGGYQATAVNGERFNVGVAGRGLWIKIETQVYNPTTEVYDVAEITQDILSLGVTEAPPPPISASFKIMDTNYSGVTNPNDSRSIIKLQRFLIEGPNIPDSGATATTGFISNGAFGLNYAGSNYVRVRGILNSTASNRCADTAIATTNVGEDAGPIPSGTAFFPGGFAGDHRAHWKTAAIPSWSTTKYGCVVPVPINMFDTREGLYNDTTTVFDPVSITAPGYGTNVPWAGVMSMIDIDVGNLKRFLDGLFDSSMPNSTPYATANSHVLRGNDIPQQNNTSKTGGWVMYISDRRGDFDFDGEYDMEDVYGNNDGVKQVGEDSNGNGSLDTNYVNEAPRYTGAGSNTPPDVAAVFEHKYFRRGVRLINGQTIPGIYNTTSPGDTRGFTVASENAIYVQGNYNASGISSVGTPTPSSAYIPASTSSLDIPASVVSDAVVVLSRAWNDSKSFTSPFAYSGRVATETTIRFGMLSGDTITSLNGTPNQGGGDFKMNGGVHNFKRFLENWGGIRLNYSGSLINLHNSRNNNAPFKCCNHVYSPPARNWVFDATFLDINRLPPGTPYFQYIQTSGFQRTND